MFPFSLGTKYFFFFNLPLDDKKQNMKGRKRNWNFCRSPFYSNGIRFLWDDRSCNVIYQFGFMNFIDVIRDDVSLLCKIAHSLLLVKFMRFGVRWLTTLHQRGLFFKLIAFAHWFIKQGFNKKKNKFSRRRVQY